MSIDKKGRTFPSSLISFISWMGHIVVIGPSFPALYYESGLGLGSREPALMWNDFTGEGGIFVQGGGRGCYFNRQSHTLIEMS